MTDTRRSDLLVELGCEELPPKTLGSLAQAFFDQVCSQLEQAGIAFEPADSRVFHTPRRLAFCLAKVAARQADRVIDRRGPAISVAFDNEGRPTRAAEGFARSVGRDVSTLETLKTEQGEWLYCRVEEPGSALGELIFPILGQALDRLPVAKPMRWADHDFSFVRPVHWLLVLHGSDVVAGSLFGHDAGRVSHGHRIHHPSPVTIASTSDYVDALKAAHVLVDPQERRQRIRKISEQAGQTTGGIARVTDALLDEVNNLVEWPVAITCAFEESFLDVPQEALIASMEDHQKFFPILDRVDGRLRPDFIAVANLESRDPEAVRMGFERVIRPRLADAQFFWNQDQKQPLSANRPALDGIVFQKNLGSIGDKSTRIEYISKKIAEVNSGIDTGSVSRAAQLCKCDLVSHMVGEFPELQGIMGAHYARVSGETDKVSTAIREHYLPRYSGDGLPESMAGKTLALADRVDTLVGIFAAGLKPTGNKDPFALRRAALGMIRLLVETDVSFDLELDRLLAFSAEALDAQLVIDAAVLADVRSFILDRARQYFRDRGIDTRRVDAALAAPLSTLRDLDQRLRAIDVFMALPAAEALVAANKRISNILRKSEDDFSADIREDLFYFDEEKHLFNEVCRLEKVLDAHFSKRDYQPGLRELSALQGVVDRFFDQVMVMDEDPLVRCNRLALLKRLKRLFDRVADFSLAA